MARGGAGNPLTGGLKDLAPSIGTPDLPVHDGCFYERTGK